MAGGSADTDSTRSDSTRSDSTSADSPVDVIELAEIREGEINVKVLRSGRKALVIKQGSDIKVFSDLCPHMGGDMTTATYCANEGTLACSWHGYVFGADDGQLRDNPNERLMSALREPSEHFRPEQFPKYRLRVLPFQIKGSMLVIEGDGS